MAKLYKTTKKQFISNSKAQLDALVLVEGRASQGYVCDQTYATIEKGDICLLVCHEVYLNNLWKTYFTPGAKQYKLINGKEVEIYGIDHSKLPNIDELTREYKDGITVKEGREFWVICPDAETIFGYENNGEGYRLSFIQPFDGEGITEEMGQRITAEMSKL